jgi:glycosyltransferase family protein
MALKYLLRAVIRKGSIVASALLPKASWRMGLRDRGDRWIVQLFRPEIEAFIKSYPGVQSEVATLRELITQGKSIARFGDGELKLMVGERHKSFQDVDAELNARLNEVLRSEHEQLMVAVHPVRDFESLGLIWQKFVIRIGREVLELLDPKRTYASTGVFHLLPSDERSKLEQRVAEIRELWSGRKVVIVVGKNSRFKYESALFGNAASVEFVYGPARNAFHHYDSILEAVCTYDPEEYLILLVLGPTATVMAHDLCLKGYQAIDFGQMPGKYRKLMDRFESVETLAGSVLS